MRERRPGAAVLLALAAAVWIAPPGALSALELRAREEPWVAGERLDDGVVEPGQALSLASGTRLGELLLDAVWTDFRGQSIAPGRYALRYALQPRLKEHVGVDRIRDFALLVPPETEIAPEAGAIEAWISASRRVSGTAHPAVLALVAWTAAGEPPAESVAAGDRLVAFHRIGALVVGFVVDGRAEPAEPF